MWLQPDPLRHADWIALEGSSEMTRRGKQQEKQRVEDDPACEQGDTLSLSCPLATRDTAANMVVKTDLCFFTELRVYPGHGRRLVCCDGRLLACINQKYRAPVSYTHLTLPTKRIV